ncbi:energy transducer TonB [Pontibacter sp. E15-1]|uniref:energy transducer TonB n=1 Tax=Pontibacter sp. E15-1 TaxID=2919918 RepID=UPI001F503790|nr:energy transducer TonB [Pontibacter sp. E15-1]MCJ8164960.1 energy transducer TonB [Pontibacter sp. E15-1]
MRKTLLLFSTLLLLFSPDLLAQDHEPKFVHEKYRHPTQLIAENMLPDVYELTKLCVNSVTFVRFVVGADGKVKNVACTQNTPAVIAKSLKQTVLTTSGHWLPKEVNGKPVESKPYLLPVMFDVNYGCPKSDKSTNKYEEAMRLVLVFDDGNAADAMECTMLPPMVQRYVKR